MSDAVEPARDEVRDRLGRWLFERDYGDRGLPTPDVATFDEYVPRNQEQWRAEADVVLDVVDRIRRGETELPDPEWA